MGMHTPGPWGVEGSTIVPESGIGGCVAEISGDNLPQMQANARLIAASPDLLEACRNAESALDSKRAVGYLAANRAEYALRALRAAIAKAEGR